MAPFGRRIVRNFLLFALVPLFAFAWHAHRQVSAELMRSASERHRRDVGSAGVILVERLGPRVQLEEVLVELSEQLVRLVEEVAQQAVQQVVLSVGRRIAHR